MSGRRARDDVKETREEQDVGTSSKDRERRKEGSKTHVPSGLDAGRIRLGHSARRHDCFGGIGGVEGAKISRCMFVQSAKRCVCERFSRRKPGFGNSQPRPSLYTSPSPPPPFLYHAPALRSRYPVLISRPARTRRKQRSLPAHRIPLVDSSDRAISLSRLAAASKWLLITMADMFGAESGRKSRVGGDVIGKL